MGLRGLCLRVLGLGINFQGLGFWGLGFGGQGLVLWVWSFWFVLHPKHPPEKADLHGSKKAAQTL